MSNWRWSSLKANAGLKANAILKADAICFVMDLLCRSNTHVPGCETLQPLRRVAGDMLGPGRPSPVDDRGSRYQVPTGFEPILKQECRVSIAAA